VLRERTSRGLCGLVCPSRTSERGGEGDCVKEGGEEKGSARGSVHWGCYYAAALKQVFICTSMVLKLRKEVEEE
jgi:hypothetical protein